jgi:hypothetical protein
LGNRVPGGKYARIMYCSTNLCTKANDISAPDFNVDHHVMHTFLHTKSHTLNFSSNAGNTATSLKIGTHIKIVIEKLFVALT